MPTFIAETTTIQSAGNKPKSIAEYVGRVNSQHTHASVARMHSPEGWEEPGQRPEFEEITVVIEGMLKVETEAETYFVREGQAIITHPGEWVRYSTPEEGGAQYIAICMPAFSPDTVHRDA